MAFEVGLAKSRVVGVDRNRTNSFVDEDCRVYDILSMGPDIAATHLAAAHGGFVVDVEGTAKRRVGKLAVFEDLKHG